MELETLKTFGMTDVEAKIYLYLMSGENNTLGEIALKTGIHRGTVYNSLNKLIEKGFVEYNPGESTTRYHISDGNIFLDLIKQEKESIKKKEDKTLEILEKIKLMQEIPTEKPKVSVAFGGKAYLEHFMSMFQLCKKNKWEYCWIGDGLGNTAKLIGEDNYMKIINTKKKMNIHFRSLMNIKARPLKHKYYKPGDRYLPEEYSFPAYTWIYGNRVVLVTFDSKPILVITIEDKSIAESYKSNFEVLYKVARA